MARIHLELVALRRTPRRVFGPLLLGLLLYSAAPLLDVEYYSTMLRRGAYSPGADSIAIPIAISITASLLFVPIFLALLWVAFRRFAPGVPLDVWRHDRPRLSWAATLGALLVAAVAAESVIHMVRHGLWLYALHGIGVLYFLAIARASFLGGLGSKAERASAKLADAR